MTNPLDAACYADRALQRVAPIVENVRLARQTYRCEPKAPWALWGKTDMETLQGCYLIRPETATATAFWLRLTVQSSPFGADDNRIVRLQDVTAEIHGWFDLRGFHEALRHKIRTPFIGILSVLDLLTEHGEELPRAEMMEFAQMEQIILLMVKLQEMAIYILQEYQLPH